jgi:hypothetical protein
MSRHYSTRDFFRQMPNIHSWLDWDTERSNAVPSQCDVIRDLGEERVPARRLRRLGDQLILDGRMDNHQVHMELQLIDQNKFLLVSRGFHWVQESKLVPRP